MLEKIPEKYKKPIDPFESVNHAKVCDYVRFRLLSSGDLSKELRIAHQSNVRFEPVLYERIMNVGKYVEPFDYNLETIDPDMRRLSSFFGGTTVAMKALDNLADETGVAPHEWRNCWLQQSLDFDHPRQVIKGEEITKEACDTIATGLMNRGWQDLVSLNATYIRLIDDISEHRDDALQDGVFKAGFGFVFKHGMDVMRTVALDKSAETRASKVLPLNDEDLDIELRQLVRIERKLAKRLLRQSGEEDAGI